MSKTKQKSAAAKNVAIFFVVFIILELLILFGFSKVFKNKDVTPSFAGYSLYIMDSDAMGSDVPQGALVIAANGAPSRDAIGKAVLAENVDGVGTSVFWLAQVASEGDTIDGVIYTLYQQKSSETEPSNIYQVKSPCIVGTAESYYLTAGKVIGFITSQFGMAVCIIIPLFLLVLLELIIAIVTHAGSSKDEDDYEEEEEEEVTLDDFLFGGENEKALHKNRKAVEEPVEEETEQADEQEEESSDCEPDEQYNEVEETVEDNSDGEQPEIDKSYYEKAEKLLDEAVSVSAEVTDKTEEIEKVEPKQTEKPKQAEKTVPDIKLEKNSHVSKTASASLEDLMMLMEEEQKKLREHLKK